MVAHLLWLRQTHQPEGREFPKGTSTRAASPLFPTPYLAIAAADEMLEWQEAKRELRKRFE